METKCLFCENNLLKDEYVGNLFGLLLDYKCPRCGPVRLTEEAFHDFVGERFPREHKRIISIALRNEFERSGEKPSSKQLKIEDLVQIVEQYRPLDPLDKMDKALINIKRASKFVGSKINIICGTDFPYYHCFEPNELRSILTFLIQEDLINNEAPSNVSGGLSITVKGYQRLRELERPGKNSRQCFVAMWFDPEMNQVYENVIKPAIEYIEEGETQPRFEAVKIDNVEHVNDINDEIIAQIRRSRFMVCDLTGYRGGVYFEAGFAYDLGLDVIYTCRKDWIKEETLCDDKERSIIELFDSNKNKIPVRKEGIHFDLAHRNRIEWEKDKLKDFKEKLKNRIKAVIF